MVRAVLLALLVAIALPVGVAGTPPNGVPAAPHASLGDIAILTLGDGSRADFATASIDVATAMAVQREAAAARLDRYALGARFERTESTEARKALLFESATAVEIRIASLRDDERAMRTAYAGREVDTETFVRRMAQIHARAALLRTNLAAIQDLADEIPQFSLRSRVSLLGANLIEFEGPVRGRVLATMRGDQAPTHVFVQASEQGVVLSAIDRGQYVREAYRADNRDTETVSGRGLDYALDRTSRLYPVAYNTSSFRTGIDTLSAGLFEIDIELREGAITAYLDGATGDVFFEVQERRLDLLGPRPWAEGAANGTRLAVNRSYAGGPLQITVTDNETGAPRRTTVLVAGERVETGPDGTVWTLAPASVSFQVRAVGPEGNVTISVRQLAPRTVGEG